MVIRISGTYRRFLPLMVALCRWKALFRGYDLAILRKKRLSLPQNTNHRLTLIFPTMQQKLDFLKESFKNLRATGSLTPSSPILCRRIAEKLDPERAQVVVELGPGDGAITRYILDRLKPDARLVIFEINEAFVQRLRQDFDDPRLHIIHDSAEHMEIHFKTLGIQQVDYFVSGIPFVMLPEALTLSITRLCRTWLRQGGRFVQFHYSPLLVNLYRRVFGNAKLDFVAWNVPPAIIVVCRKMA